MICWVLYDIKKDKPRTGLPKNANLPGCTAFRNQFSWAAWNENEKDTLQLEVNELIDEETDSVYIFPMSKNELRQTVLLGQAFDKKLVTDEVKALFF